MPQIIWGIPVSAAGPITNHFLRSFCGHMTEPHIRRGERFVIPFGGPAPLLPNLGSPALSGSSPVLAALFVG